MLDQLKEVGANLERLDIDEAVGLLAYGKTVIATYEQNDLETPDWLTGAVNSLSKYIKTKAEDNYERELRQTDLQLENLKTREERREGLVAKQARLRQKLGK